MTHLGVAAAAGVIAGLHVGHAVSQSTAALSQLLSTQLALTLFLRSLGLVQIDWQRLRSLCGAVLRLPIWVARAAFARREAERRQREADKWAGRLPAGESGEGGDAPGKWAAILHNQHAAAGGTAGFAMGLCAGLGLIGCRPGTFGWDR